MGFRLYIPLFLLCGLYSCVNARLICSNDGYLAVREYSTLFMNCIEDEPIRNFTWKIQPWRNQTSVEKVCREAHECSFPPDIDVHLLFRDIYFGILRVVRSMFNYSTISFTITSDLTSRQVFTRQWLIDVVYDAVVTSCDLEVYKPTWMVRGSCDVTQVYSSRGNYSYVVFEQHSKINSTRAIYGPANYISSMTSYTDTSKGYEYFRGRFNFSFPLTNTSGHVTYSVEVTPGKTRKKINNTIVIEPPGIPKLTNCNQTIEEGGNLPTCACECAVTSLGSPSGRLHWRTGSLVLNSGSYGDTRILLPYEKLNRTHNASVITCFVDWVVKQNGESFTASVLWKEEEVVKEGCSQPPDRLGEGVGIGVGSTLAVVLSVLVMLLLLSRRRSLACCVPIYDTPSKERQKKEEEEHTYSGMSTYEIVDHQPTHSKKKKTSVAKKTQKAAQERVYVNTVA